MVFSSLSRHNGVRLLPRERIPALELVALPEQQERQKSQKGHLLAKFSSEKAFYLSGRNCEKSLEGKQAPNLLC
jgi:hypothetical protein